MRKGSWPLRRPPLDLQRSEDTGGGKKHEDEDGDEDMDEEHQKVVGISSPELMMYSMSREASVPAPQLLGPMFVGVLPRADWRKRVKNSSRSALL